MSLFIPQEESAEDDSDRPAPDPLMEGLVRNCEDAFRTTRARAEDVLFAECLKKVESP